MGFIIGEETYPTWLRLRRVVFTNNSGSPGITGGDFNQVYPAGNYFLKTSQGNGFVRGLGNATPSAGFTFYESVSPGSSDQFYAGGWVEPNNETILGKLVTTTGSSFNIQAEAFTDGQLTGEGGSLPIVSVDLFDFLT